IAPCRQPGADCIVRPILVEPPQRAVGLLVGHGRGPLKIVAEALVECVGQTPADEGEYEEGVRAQDDDNRAHVPHRERNAETLRAESPDHGSSSWRTKPTPRMV